MQKKEKGLVGCLTCGTSIGCLFPLALVLGLVLVVGASNYFDSSYYWEQGDTWLVIILALIVMPAVFVGLMQAAIGIWALAGFFDSDVKPEELNLLTAVPSVDGAEKEDNA